MIKAKIIYVSGAHGTGKTTFVNDLSKKLIQSGFRVYIAREEARAIAEFFSDPSIVVNISSEVDQLTLLASQLCFYNEVLLRYHYYDFIIFDRSIVDTLSYQICLFPNCLERSLHKYLINRISNSIKFDKSTVFYLPIEFELDINGRFADKNFQSNVDIQIRKLYADFSIDTYLLSGSRYDRLYFALEALKHVI